MSTENTGLPLEQYNKSSPPGWKTGIPKYTFRRYLERLRLWYRQTDLSSSQVGPAVAGRLIGRPFDDAMALTITTGNGTVLTGDAALAFEGEDANPNLGTPALSNGLQHLLRVLTAKHGADDQQQVIGTLDAYEDFRRGKLSLLEYLNEEESL